MTTNYNSPEDSATLECRKCHEVIELRSEDDVLDKFGGFVRLRCNATDCGNEDWYKKPACTPPPNIAPQALEGPGEVWIHDVILGLSFRAESA